jgi:hypothetical protein
LVTTDTVTTQDFVMQPKGRLYGYVTDFDNGFPLEATVTADDGTMANTDPATGYHEMYLDEGSYVVTASAEDYADGVATVDIVSGEDTQRDFALKAAVVFSPTPLHVTLDWQTTDTADATLMNRMVEPYEFEFFEIPGGFIPLLLGEATKAPAAAQGRVVEGAEAKGAAESLGGGALPEDAGGPDPFGYTYVDSDEPGGPSFEWIEISGTGQNLNLSDDSHYFPIALPFTFNYYGTDYTQISVASNGTLYFEDLYIGYGNGCLPDTSYGVLNYMAGYWDDLNPGAGGAVYYEAVNYQGQDLAVIEWYQVPHYGTSDPVTYEIILFPNGSMLMQYLDASSEQGSGGTVGIQGYGVDPSYYLEYSCNATALADELAICFAYPGSAGCVSGGDVPWLGEDPIAGTVPASGTLEAPGTLDVTMYFTATYDAGVDQPGDYYADLLVSGDPDLMVRVTLTVLAPDTFGKLTGVVAGLGHCDDETYPLADAQVMVEDEITVTSDASGVYVVWLEEGIYTVTTFAEDHTSTSAVVTITGQQTTTQDLDLRSIQPCMSVTPDYMEATLESGDSVMQMLTLVNDGAGPSEFSVRETTEIMKLIDSVPIVNSIAFSGVGDVPWLSEYPTEGLVEPDSTFDVEVTFTALPTLPLGIYTATLIVETDDAVEPEFHIPVQMEIVECVKVSDVVLALLTEAPIYPGDLVGFAADIMPDSIAAPYSYTIEYDDGTAPVTGASSDDPMLFDYTYALPNTYTVEFWAWNCDMEAPVTDTVNVVVTETPLPPMHYIYLPIVIKDAE